MEAQKSLAELLDRETTKIDALIDKKIRLIDLLNEKRTAVITQAVTKGLNPDAPMKDSGVEWLGEVPEHWEVTTWGRLKRVLTDYTANGSFAALKSNVTYFDTVAFARLIRLTDLRRGVPPGEGVYVDEHAYRFLSKTSLAGGEFLIANVGAYAGLVREMPNIDMPATLGPNMMMAKFSKSKVIPKFMVVLGNSAYVQTQLRSMATAASAQPKLNKDNFRSVRIALPPKDEQEAIVKYFDAKTSKINVLITKVKAHIEKLREYRSALITAAVTGKIDVREAT